MRPAWLRALPLLAGALCLLGILCWKSFGHGRFDQRNTAEATSALSAPASGDELGNTFEGFGAANWGLGRYPGYKFAIAFTPKTGKPLSAMSIVWKTARGYGAGTFGIWSFELRTDNPRGHVPSDTILARLDGKANPPEGYFKLAFPNVPLKAGDIYHLVMYNTDPNAKENWSSPNTIMSIPDHPWKGDGVLTFDGRSWREWGARENRCAPFHGSRAAYLLEYADGTKEGEPYYFAYEHRIHDGVYQGEQFIWERPDTPVRQFGFSVYSVGEPHGDLRMVLEDMNGKVLASDIAAKADSITELPSWQHVTLAEPVTLKKGVGYRLYLKAPECAAENCFATYVVYATAAVPGWNDQTWGGNTACAVTFDGAWKRTPVPADLTFSMIAE